MEKKNKPVRKEQEIKQNPDNNINEDLKDYPNGLAKNETIRPKTKKEKETADIYNKDGEKINYKRNEIDEQDSDGSANAFERR